MKRKCFLSLLLCGLLIFTLLPTAVSAQTHSITTSGEYDLSADLNVSDGDTLSIGAGLTITLKGSMSRTYTSMQIVCGEGVSLTLNDVRINNGNVGDFCALSFTGKNNILKLMGNNYLVSSGGQSGVKAENSTELTITGFGILTAVGGSMPGAAGAGIGGSAGNDGGFITINSSLIAAVGSSAQSISHPGTIIGSAGIGGGALDTDPGSYCIGGRGGTIVINSGTVEAWGGGGASGIGGCTYYGGGNITINGGAVSAHGGKSNFEGGSGIGGGFKSNGGEISISGGAITTYSSGKEPDGAGIGNDGAKIAISGGTITACIEHTSGSLVIGGSYIGGSNGTTIITGGSINAYKVLPLPTNGPALGEAPVHLAAVTVPGITMKARIPGLTITNAGYYGTKDMYTDASGRLYLYIPDGAEVMQVYTQNTIFNNVSGTLTADTTPPMVTSVTPSGTGEACSGSIAITFNEEMRKISCGVLLDGKELNTTGSSWGGTSSNVYTIPYSGLAYGSTHTITIAGFMDYSGNSMASDFSCSFTTEPDPSYIPHTLTDSSTGVTVSGNIHRDAVLSVQDIDFTNFSYDSIHQKMEDKKFITLFGKDISLSQGFIGELTITIPVDNALNGKSVTILHYTKEGLKTYTRTVSSGNVTFNVSSLSPFGIFADADISPNTGDNTNLWIWMTTLAIAAVSAAALIVLKKRKQQY